MPSLASLRLTLQASSLVGLVAFATLLAACAETDGPGGGADADAAGKDAAADSTGADGGGNDAGGDASPDATGDTGGGGPATTDVCPNAPKASGTPGDAICAIEAGTGGTLIVADLLLAADAAHPNGHVLRQGGVLFDDKGEITCVGCECADKAAGATRVICPEAVVTPGLIDAHNHIGWLNGRPWVAAEAKVDPNLRWEHRHDWRQGKGGHPKVSVDGGGAGADDKVWGELRYLIGGGTAMFGSGDLSGLLRDLDATGSGDHGLGVPKPDYDTFPLGDTSGTQKAEGCDYSALGSAPPKGRYVPHVAEGINHFARNEFLCMSGNASGGKETLGAEASVIHGVGLRAVDYAWMAAKGVNLIWSPRSNISLYGDTAPVVVAHRLGVGIGIGGDWVPSGSMNMLRELQCAAFLDEHRFGGYFGPARLWEMATLGGARALGLESRVGVLAPGHVADLAVFAKRGRQGHDAVVKAKPGDAVLVYRGGTLLIGHKALAGQLGKDCEDIAAGPDGVCGTPLQACVKAATGKTLAEVRTKVEAKAYPLFFCGDPKDEPSCLPARSLTNDSIDGSTVYSGQSVPEDTDGDGIANGVDACPTVFSPVRPVDDGKQADSDGDGKGDACDACPLDADTTVCKTFNPNDPDGDGLPAGSDNCPSAGNADQGDKDKDGKGDVCDSCPDAANPGDAGCPAKVAQVKTDPAFIDTRVSVANLVVTASAKDGFFAQDPAASAPAHSGIFVYTGSGERPKRGATIDITAADVTDYFGQIELTKAAFVVKSGAPLPEPAPAALEGAALASLVATDKNKSGFEGLLVKVVKAVVKDDKPAGGTGDTTAANEFELDSGLRLDDGMWEAEGFLTPTPAKGSKIMSIVGVIAWRNGHMKLLPRTMADVDLGPPVVQSLTPATAWQRVGVAGVGLAVPVTLTVSAAPSADLLITVTADDPSIAAPIGPFTVPAGKGWISLGIDGKKAGKTTFRAKAPGNEGDITCEVVVLAADATPAVAAVLAPSPKVPVGTTTTLDILLGHPAPKLGLKAQVTAVGGKAIAPAEVVFAGDALTAKVAVQVGDVPGKIKVKVTTAIGSAEVEVEAVAASQLQLDLGGWKVLQTASDKTLAIPAGSKLGAGKSLIVGRKATQAEFEAFWKIKLPVGTVYLNGDDKFPGINGEETFSLQDGGGKLVDGPTVAMGTGKFTAYKRKLPIGPAGDVASWLGGVAGPEFVKPGTHCALGSEGGYISAFSDALGTGAFNFEFVEICFAGPKG